MVSLRIYGRINAGILQTMEGRWGKRTGQLNSGLFLKITLDLANYVKANKNKVLYGEKDRE